jgi:hypothetical protein
MPPRFASQNEDAIMSNGVRTPPPSKRPVAGRVDSPPGREELPRIYARRKSDCSSSCRLPPEPPSTGQAVRYARRLHRRFHDPIPVHSTSHSLPPAGILHPNYPPRFHRQLPCASLIPGSCAGKILCAPPPGTPLAAAAPHRRPTRSPLPSPAVCVPLPSPTSSSCAAPDLSFSDPSPPPPRETGALPADPSPCHAP